MLSAGERYSRVQVYNVAYTVDGTGNRTKVLTAFGTLWCNMKQISNPREIETSKTFSAVSSHIMTLLKNSDLTHTMIGVIDGVTYSFSGVTNAPDNTETFVYCNRLDDTATPPIVDVSTLPTDKLAVYNPYGTLVPSELSLTDLNDELIAFQSSMAATYPAFPSQSSNGGKFLSTDGSSLSWSSVSAGGGNYLPLAGGTLTGPLTINDTSGVQDTLTFFIDYDGAEVIVFRPNSSFWPPGVGGGPVLNVGYNGGIEGGQNGAIDFYNYRSVGGDDNGLDLIVTTLSPGIGAGVERLRITGGSDTAEIQINNSVLSTAAAGDSPSNDSTPAGWIKIKIGTSDAWLPFYQ